MVEGQAVPEGRDRELRETLSEEVDWNKRLRFSEHHLSHAASAFYPSPFNEAAILTMDGVGEWTTTSLAIGYGRSFTASGSVEVFESPSSGPTIEWADWRDLPIWSVMPFAKCSSAIAVLADQIRNRNARLRLPSGSTLFRFLRLLGHGARVCTDVWCAATNELQFATEGHKHHRFPM
jgi:carbamoyltransferase-like protein